MECDVRIFPRDRIQRLLDHRKYEGLGSTVKVEGSFIQVGSGGIPERQVFLGITPSEFVIVKQVTYNMISVVPVNREIIFRIILFFAPKTVLNTMKWAGTLGVHKK